jgi:SAM-dependent methyltransferase
MKTIMLNASRRLSAVRKRQAAMAVYWQIAYCVKNILGVITVENYLTGNLYSNTAAYYDYDNRDIIKDDLDFYVGYINQTKGSVLELASGTGRVSLYACEKAGRKIQCIEYSENMVELFRHKLQTTHRHLQEKISIHKGDMSCFDLGRKFEYIMIPWRSLQFLPVQEQGIECLKCVHNHLSDSGIFVFAIFKPMVYDEKWLGKENVSYDIIYEDKRIIRSTVNHYADTVKKYIQYKNKIRILVNGNEIIKEDLLTLKYYSYDDITHILKSLGFNIREEYGYYDKSRVEDGEEMIFVCTK